MGGTREDRVGAGRVFPVASLFDNSCASSYLQQPPLRNWEHVTPDIIVIS